MIATLGFPTDAIDCGEEVVKRARAEQPSLIIIDCGLPDSFDLIAAIRAEPKNRTTPLVMFATGGRNLRELALLKGANAYVPKTSLDWGELLHEVKKLAGPAPKKDRT